MQQQQPYFFIRLDNQCVKINYSDISFIEASRNFVRIITEQKTYLVLMSLKQAEAILPPQQFCRVHRSYILSLDKVSSFDYYNAEIVYGGKKASIPIGHLYRDSLYQRITVVAYESKDKVKLSNMSIDNLLSD